MPSICVVQRLTEQKMDELGWSYVLQSDWQLFFSYHAIVSEFRFLTGV